MTSSYLLRPLRSEAEAREDRQKRLHMTPAKALAIKRSQGDLCPVCDLNISDNEMYEIDHWTASGLGGSDDPTNLRALHATCHRKIKTPADLKMIAKGKRQKARQDAHDEAMEKGARRPNAKERKLKKWQDRAREARTGPERQE